VASLGILGAGRVGTSLARAALKAGYSVNIAASGAAEKISLITEIMAPGATAMTAADVVASADLVVLAIPLHKFRSLDRDSNLLSRKTKEGRAELNRRRIVGDRVKRPACNAVSPG
jgi:predicted dinucleotide-binding enzyme